MSNGSQPNAGQAQPKPADQNGNDKVARMAFELFTERRAANTQRHPEQVAAESFRDAEAFIAVTARRANGESTDKMLRKSALQDCSAPNLKKTHPINLVSQRFGAPDLKRVRDIHNRLLANPTLDELGDDDLGWTKEGGEVATARQLFPSVLAAADAN